MNQRKAEASVTLNNKSKIKMFIWKTWRFVCVLMNRKQKAHHRKRPSSSTGRALTVALPQSLCSARGVHKKRWIKQTRILFIMTSSYWIFHIFYFILKLSNKLFILLSLHLFVHVVLFFCESSSSSSCVFTFLSSVKCYFLFVSRWIWMISSLLFSFDLSASQVSRCYVKMMNQNLPGNSRVLASLAFGQWKSVHSVWRSAEKVLTKFWREANQTQTEGNNVLPLIRVRGQPS